MDSEDFYDSLDDESTLSGATVKSRQKVALKSVEKLDLSSLVPLYQKEILKEDIKQRPNQLKQRRKDTFVKTLLPSRTDIYLTKSKRKPKEEKEMTSKQSTSKSSIISNSSLSSILEGKPKKSYLDLFHAKIGFVQGGTGPDTTRAVKDEESFRSAMSTQSENTEFLDAVSYVSDDSSFYINFLEEEKRKDIEADDTITNAVSTLTLSESKFNLKSVSEYSLKSKSIKTGNTRKSNASFKITKYNKSIIDVPTMGRLGPDPEAIKEKMEKLKRQQTYGQRVSNQNRMRMLELQVIRNFNHEMKKSSDINKSAKNLLIA